MKIKKSESKSYEIIIGSAWAGSIEIKGMSRMYEVIDIVDGHYIFKVTNDSTNFWWGFVATRLEDGLKDNMVARFCFQTKRELLKEISKLPA